MQLNYFNLISHEILPYVTLFRKKTLFTYECFPKKDLRNDLPYS